MQNDITDGVRWAIQQGIADPKRVGIYGGSFGGYATLAGITFTPEVYACAVDVVGPSDVKTLLDSIPDDWKPVKKGGKPGSELRHMMMPSIVKFPRCIM